MCTQVCHLSFRSVTQEEDISSEQEQTHSKQSIRSSAKGETISQEKKTSSKELGSKNYHISIEYTEDKKVLSSISF